jgi:hypothetical protein
VIRVFRVNKMKRTECTEYTEKAQDNALITVVI